MQLTLFPRIGLFVFYFVNSVPPMVYALSLINIDNRYSIVSVWYAFVLAAPFVHVLVFFLVNHAMCLCYDDWTTKMLGATLQHSGEVNLLLQEPLTLTALKLTHS